MKTLGNAAKNYLDKLIPECPKDKIILHVMKRGYQQPLNQPTSAGEIICDLCGGNSGFYIPHLQTWSCRNQECILKNATKVSNYKQTEKPKNEQVISYVDQCNQPEDVKKAFRSFSQMPYGFIVLAGNPGTGKTHLSKACLEDFKCDSSDKHFISQTDLFQKWKITVHEYAGDDSFMVDKYSSYKLLILDDLGRKPTEAFMDFLYSVVDKRNTNKKGTIVTTNLNALQMRESFGDAFVSRIASGKCLRFEGKDRRTQEF